ncbi:hypothetical protein SDRG_14833 [Saprolegnia diclina VS20]|uniref:Uncharacterized protein n=1 Tax=Saprolegnia diclina (strain VS20) TaxID=1156394 RepID=T0RCU3_SAPDV|nr:hypothetical protein SDRG_14833 [Saprolegnia diclina VS20]EQC27392.1 hypothetical protein SDRG_14833 [Saprolegnia diclina VS20]|eukprot:XP_008619211.1 hypothetical protein SDRG_14833 [Saprolegnia diclina VS20]
MNTVNPTDNECQYTYKPCTNPRSRKKSGSLHSFCEKRLREADAMRAITTSRPTPIEPTRTRSIATSASFDVEDIRFLNEWLLDTNNVDADDYLDETSSSTSPLTAEDYAILCDIFRGP